MPSVRHRAAGAGWEKLLRWTEAAAIKRFLLPGELGAPKPDGIGTSLCFGTHRYSQGGQRWGKPDLVAGWEGLERSWGGKLSRPSVKPERSQGSAHQRGEGAASPSCNQSQTACEPGWLCLPLPRKPSESSEYFGSEILCQRFPACLLNTREKA